MCRHHEAWLSSLEGQPGQDAKRAAGDSLSDITEGLELSKKLLLLADGHWKECEHPGGLPLQGILKECALRIADEAQRRRRELEGSGRVHFGSVVLDEGADDHGPDPATAPEWSGLPFLAGHPQDPATRFLSGTSPAVSLRNTLPSPLGGLRRLCVAFLTRPSLGGQKWFAAGPRQGGE